MSRPTWRLLPNVSSPVVHSILAAEGIDPGCCKNSQKGATCGYLTRTSLAGNSNSLSTLPPERFFFLPAFFHPHLFFPTPAFFIPTPSPHSFFPTPPFFCPFPLKAEQALPPQASVNKLYPTARHHLKGFMHTHSHTSYHSPAGFRL